MLVEVAAGEAVAVADVLTIGYTGLLGSLRRWRCRVCMEFDAHLVWEVLLKCPISAPFEPSAVPAPVLPPTSSFSPSLPLSPTAFSSIVMSCFGA